MWIGISGSMLHLLLSLLAMCLFMCVVALAIMQGVATDVVAAAVAENQSCTRSLEMPHLGPSNAASHAVEALWEL